MPADRPAIFLCFRPGDIAFECAVNMAAEAHSIRSNACRNYLYIHFDIIEAGTAYIADFDGIFCETQDSVRILSFDFLIVIVEAPDA